QLRVSKGRILLGQVLRRESLRPPTPSTLFSRELIAIGILRSNNVQSRELAVTFRIDVVLLSNGGTERIVRIILDRLHGSQLVITNDGLPLVGVEHHVNAIRKVIRVHCHTLDVVRTVNHDTNLSILSA